MKNDFIIVEIVLKFILGLLGIIEFPYQLFKNIKSENFMPICCIFMIILTIICIACLITSIQDIKKIKNKK